MKRSVLLISLLFFSYHSYSGLCTCPFQLSPGEYQSVDPPTFLWLAPNQPPPPMCYFGGYWLCINKGSCPDVYSLQCNFTMFTFNNQYDSCFTIANSSWSQLIVDTPYYWVMRTVGGPVQWCPGCMGPIKRLPAALPPPNLISPVNGASSVSLTPLLHWDNIDSATSYRIKIFSTQSLNTLVLDTLVGKDSMNVAQGKLISNQRYWWKVKPLKSGGEGPFSDVFNFTTGITGIRVITTSIPLIFSLSQNYPNPFNPTTKIKFAIPNLYPPFTKGGQGGLVRLIIYDLLGREVATLVNEKLNPGTYEVEWNASSFPSGVYFYKLITESFNQIKRMVLLK